MALQPEHLLAGFDVPDTDRRIRPILPSATHVSAAGGVGSAAVRGEGYAEDPLGMAPELADQITRFEVPEADDLVRAAGESAAAVGAKATHRTHPASFVNRWICW